MSNSFLYKLEQKSGIILNEEQQRAVSHIDGPALTLAIPGSGKTTLTLCRTVHLIEEAGVHPSQILTVTFSKAAASDMKYRYEKTLAPHFNHDLSFATIHRFAYNILRQYSKSVGKPFNLIEDKATGISKFVLFNTINKQLKGEILTEDKFDEVTNEISYIKNKMIQPEDFGNFNFKTGRLDELYNAYERYKRQNRLIDFDDMLSYAYKILQKNPQALEAYQNKYRYIQVDETQDTSKLQHALLKLLANPKNNIFMVADDDQSIYGFRGAEPEFLLNFKDHYAGGNIYYLKNNYRSSQEIVSVCNATIQNNRQRYAKRIETQNPKGQPVKIINFSTLEKRNAFMANSLKNDTSTTGILFRNNVSSISIVDYLERYNISYSIRDNKLQFFKHWVVRDLKAFLNLALIHNDKESFQRIYYKMNGYISKASCEYVMRKSMSSVFTTLTEVPNINTLQKTTFQRIREDFTKLSNAAPYDAIAIIESDLGYLKYLNDNAKRMGYAYDSLRTIISSLKSIALSCSTILEFLDRLNHLETVMKQKNHDYNAPVKLTTIHSAKGLEFDRVFLVDMEDELFPSKKSVEASLAGNFKELEEERRLFYVGISRAKRDLNILNIKFKNGSYVKPSPFLDEITADKDALEIINMTKDIDTSESNGSAAGSQHLFTVGDQVEHMRFGPGVIASLNQDIIGIQFEVGLKELSLRLCLEKNLLK